MILLTFIFIMLLAIFPETTAKSVALSLDMCLKSVIPSLFPFLIASNIIMEIKPGKNTFFLFLAKFFNISPGSVWAYITGIVCGYPIGGKIVLELFEKGELDESEKDRLLVFANNSGPGFIIGMVGGSLFKSTKAGVVIYLSHILASLTFGFITSFFARSKREVHTKNTYHHSFSQLLSESIKKGLESSINITGVICFFSAIISLLDLIPFISSLPFKGLLYGLLEMTNGIRIITASLFSLKLKVAFSSFLLTFSGFSVFMQLKTFSDKIKPAPYFLCKMLCGIFAFIYAYFLV